MGETVHWQQRVGSQRDWMWRGWRSRYTYMRASQPTSTHPPLILLHGFGASIGHWRHNLPDLSQQHTVYALDLLGFGASDKAVAPYDITLWAEQVYDFWQTFVRQPVILVGNSIGSSVCLAAAAMYPDMVAGIVMISLPDSSVLEMPAVMRSAMQCSGWMLRPVLSLTQLILTSPVIFSPFFWLLRRRWLIRNWIRLAYVNPSAITDELIEILALPAYQQGAARALRAMINSPRSSQYRAKTVLPTLTIPMLLIWGKKDGFVPPKLAPLFVQHNPALELVELDEAGHCPHDECPEQVNDTILNWIQRWQKEKQDSEGLRDGGWGE